MEISAKKRELQGTSASRRLRKTGSVPGVVYGAGEPAVAIELDHNTLYHSLKKEAFHSSVLTLDIDGAKQQVLLRDTQQHGFKPLVLHVDFQRVDPKEKIHMKVPFHFINADVAPGVKLSHGVIAHLMTEADVACLPKDLPEFIEVNLAELEVGHSIHLSQLKLAKGVEFVDLHHNNDKAVVSIPAPRGGVAAEEAAE
ncbi:MAG: 50S ribosomal protein L25/general stress protein Ctc [Burkholderiales bacterium]